MFQNEEDDRKCFNLDESTLYIKQGSIGIKKPYKVSIYHPFHGFTDETS